MMRQIRSILALPFIVLLAIPAVITLVFDGLSVGWGLAPPLSFLPIALGLALMALGLLLMVHTIRLFVTVGEGTLAPWDPTQRLVVRGTYRYVRNPMISGVLSILLGEAVLLGSLPVFIWFALFLVGNAIYMPLSEEPGLEERFGEEYRQYKRNVPRWLPRHTPWEGPSSGEDMGRYG